MKMLSIVGTLPIAAVAASLAGAPVVPDALKCGRANAMEPHYIVDGVFTAGPHAPEGTGTTDVRREDIQALYVVCWDPVRRVLQFKGTGEPVIYVATKQFMAGLHEDMTRVVAAQDAFREQHGSFSGSITGLDVELDTPGLVVDLTASESGWHATAGGALLLVRCHVFAGSITPPQPDLTERDPTCRTLPAD